MRVRCWSGPDERSVRRGQPGDARDQCCDYPGWSPDAPQWPSSSDHDSSGRGRGSFGGRTIMR